MAITVSINSLARDFHDYSLMANRDMKLIPISIAFDSSYPTGGEPFSLDGVSDIMTFLIEGSGIYQFNYDYTNNKIIGYVMSTGLEIGNATDLSALTDVRGLLLGY